ncbi:expressed unknown protein [Seminavis robusta]|uniref:Uncharacterized protein n=1 Tax=Seminavis robusta TaxID=568900 RepID=A0A9N8HWK5_9STRA|nr:expressed unknown protein [Seminavis robusta]|eukprot:Sro1664_g289530.1 n/a (591) ;mRNA; f:21722-23494
MVRFIPSIRRLMAMAIAFSLCSDNGMLARAQTNTTTDKQSTRLSLAASNPFRMIVRPTLFELDFVALSIVEEAMTKAILLSTGSSLVDVSININQMNWLSSSDDDDSNELIDGTVKTLGTERVPTTVLKFFAVGTFLLKPASDSTNPAGSLALVQALDEIIESAFKQENYVAFIELLRNSGDPLLDGVQDVAAIRTDSNIPLPEPSPTFGASDDDSAGDDGAALTTLDIVLISVSASIFLGIVYMIFQHHKDRGYIENQRIQNLNTYDRRNNPASDSSYAPSPHDDDHRNAGTDRADHSIRSADTSKTSVINNRQPTPRAEDPSHDSSLFTTSRGSEDHSFVTNFSIPPSPTDINTHLNSRKSRFSSKVRISVESVQCDSRSLPTPTRKAMTSTSSVQSQEDECKSTGALSITAFSTVLSSDFGPINWFRKSGSKGPATLLSATDDNIEEVVEEGGSSGSSRNTTTSSSSSCSSSSSEDVFHVGGVKANVIATGSVANASDTVSSKASSSVVTEWMRTIQVISSTDSKSESEVTCKASSSEQSSTAENSSAEAPSVGDDEASDIVSLEHSMANSRGGVAAGSEADLTMEF